MCGCTANKEQFMPDDFYFIFEGGNSTDTFLTLLDTKKSIIGRDLYTDYISSSYHIPESELKKIYNNIIKYEIKDLNSESTYKSDNMTIIPNYYHKILFNIDNVIYTVIYDGSIDSIDDKKIKKLLIFHKYIMDFYENTEEYKEFPRPSFLPY